MLSEDLRNLQYSQSEGYVEYSADGRVLNVRSRLPQKSKYEEDELIGNHTSIWGSYYEIGTSRWGFKCCKQCFFTRTCISQTKHKHNSGELVCKTLEGPQPSTKVKTVAVLKEMVLRVDNREKNVQHLLSSVKSLGSFLRGGSEFPTESIVEIERLQKLARNLSEDVVEDTLALDSLEDLNIEEREARRVVLATLEALSKKVDEARSALLNAQRECEQYQRDITTKKNEKKAKRKKHKTKKQKKRDKKKSKNKVVDKRADKTKKLPRDTSTSCSSSSSSPS